MKLLCFAGLLLLACVSAASVKESCYDDNDCDSLCCILQQTSDNPGPVVTVGYYCSNSCTRNSTTGQLIQKNPGESCALGNECASGCCEELVCRTQNFCYNKYLLPFIALIGIIAGVILIAIIWYCISRFTKTRKSKRIRNRIDQQEAKLLAKEEPDSTMNKQANLNMGDGKEEGHHSNFENGMAGGREEHADHQRRSPRAEKEREEENE